MTRAPRSARFGGCATAAALATVVLAAPAHAEPIAACPPGFTMVQGDPGFPPGLWDQLDLNNDDALCFKQVREEGFLFIDNRVRA